MPIRGRTQDILLLPVGNKELDEHENLLPNHLDLRNGFITDAGNWHKRPGYNSGAYDLGVDFPVNRLIPEDQGYALSGEGGVYKLDGVGTATLMPGRALNGSYRPSYTNHQGNLLLFDGGEPVKISGGVTSLVPGLPPRGRWSGVLDTYVITAGGYSETQFNWSKIANSGVWPAANFNAVSGNGEEIMHFSVFKRTMFFFKTKSIETWINVGGTTTFARQSYLQRGTIASDSVVQANDTFYFLGDDGDFYKLNGLQPTVISEAYRRELDKIPKANQAKIYGFDYRKEHLIRWFAPVEGKCFVFNYRTNTFSEDNTWLNGQFERLPHNSYMELEGKQYFGDYDLTGKIYEWDKSFKDDNGAPIRVFRKMQMQLSENGNAARINRLRLRLKRGENDSQLSVRWRFDGGAFCPPEVVSLGALGDYDSYVDVGNGPLGFGRDFELEFVETDAIDYLLTSAALTLEPLGA